MSVPIVKGGSDVKIGKVVVQVEGSRPWAGGKSAGPKGRQPQHPISARRKAEIDKCLHCTRTDCMGFCPGPAKVGRPKIPVPEDFVKRSLAGARTKELAKHYGVSRATVCVWRKETGLAGKSAGKEVTLCAEKRPPGSKR